MNGMDCERRVGRLRRLVLLAPLLCMSCVGANLDRDDQGRLQPQTVRGPCQVKKFFILAVTTVPTDMTVANTGQACDLTLFDPNLQLTLSAALLTGQPAHGRAAAILSNVARQVAISYAPRPGYAGPDQFRVTLEPNDLGITFNVIVTPRP